MNHYIDTLKQILTSYWGDSLFYYLFVVALVVVFFRVKDEKKKNIFFWLPMIMYIALLSPLGIILGTKFLSADMSAYMCRLISFVPIFYIIAYACVLLTEVVTSYKKYLCVVGLGLCIMLCGSKLIYVNDGYRFERSENVYKIPTDLMTICDYMDSVDDDPVVALNTGLSYMARQYDPSLHLLVGARLDGMKFSDELGDDEPDVPYIMQTTCAWAGDFVIVNNKESVRKAFSDAGFSPCFETCDFLLYEAGGYPGIRFVYNEIEQISRRDFYDETGELCLTDDGVASVEYEYDANGRVVKERYLDVGGSPVINIHGFAGLKNYYGETGNLEQVDYLGLNGKPIVSEELGYASVLYTRDERGNATEEHYFDEIGEPISLPSGYSGLRRVFDLSNRVTSLTYLDGESEPVANVDGIASIIYDYENEFGVLELYKDPKGNPVANINGCYGMINRHAANGLLLYQIYTDENGQPVKGNAGYSKVAYMYDRNNRLIRVSYFDSNDYPALCTDGYAGYRRSYDQAGNVIDVYYGVDGSVVELTDSAA